jgi:predicted DNA-binding transcriptional regulator YafY
MRRRRPFSHCWVMTMDEAVEVDYTNWKGERRMRRIRPNGLHFGSVEWHPEPQWLLHALDLDSGKNRYFAMQNIHSWKPI